VRPPRPDGPRPAAAVALLVVSALALSAAGAPTTGAGRDASHPKRAERIDPPAKAAPPANDLGPGESAVLRGRGDLVLEIRVTPGLGWTAIGQRYLVDLRELGGIKEENGEALTAGRTVRIPYSSLNDETRLRVVRALFPRDEPGDGEWIHRVGEGRLAASDESLWNLALWLTGRGENFAALADRNHLPALLPQAGQIVAIPAELLLPPFARLVGVRSGSRKTAASEQADAGAPGSSGRDETAGGDAGGDDDFTEAAPETEPAPPPGAGPAVPPAEGAEDLRYGKDADGPYAAYRLKRGEALYSAVVVRYTGRVDAADVSDLARTIAKRSGIRDVTDIAIGFRVKIPLDLLLPEYLPPGDPRRAEWERGRAEVSRYTNAARSRDLKDVAVILDAGHGGRDEGAAHNGLWEHDYVYDILCRIKARLESTTGAKVLPTIRDRREGYAVHETTRLPRSQAEVLLTDPPFPLSQPVAGVNLRWYLANSYYRRLLAGGQDPAKVVFTSLHADARHPSLGGAMVYVPGEQFRRGRYGHDGATYARYREAREQPYVSFTRADRDRSEGLSRQFAAVLVEAFRRRGVSVHPFGPVRERIIRRGRSWVPAVLRCNQVPVEVLVEVSNLNNLADSRLLADPVYRQKVADAYVDSLQAYYGNAPRPARAPSARGR
jgi:N-acetylmuramoyl-L-alanine amidase